MLEAPRFALRQASALATTRNRDCAIAREQGDSDPYLRAPTVSRATDALFLGRTRNDAQNFLLFHDEEIFSIKFDFGSGVLAEQNGVAFLQREWEQFAFLVGLALPHRDDRAFLWFIFGRIGDDEASPRSSRFFFAAHQDAVMQWSKFRCHNCQLLLIHVVIETWDQARKLISGSF